jgi:hypothetical protein
VLHLLLFFAFTAAELSGFWSQTDVDHLVHHAERVIQNFATLEELFFASKFVETVTNRKSCDCALVKSQASSCHRSSEWYYQLLYSKSCSCEVSLRNNCKEKLLSSNPSVS